METAQLPFEFMLNALRLTEGFEAQLFPDRTGLSWEVVEAPMRALLERGLLVSIPQGYRPSTLGMRFLNDVLVEFLPEMPEKSYVSTLSTPTPEAASGQAKPLYSQATGGRTENERITRQFS